MIFLPVSTDLFYRVAGTGVGVALGAATGVWEAVLSPMYLHVGHSYVRLPLSVVLAIASNAGLVWFTFTITGHTWLSLLPGAAWFGIMVLAAGETSEGDLIITGNNWVGLLTILFGSVAWAFAGYRLILGPRRL